MKSFLSKDIEEAYRSPTSFFKHHSPVLLSKIHMVRGSTACSEIQLCLYGACYIFLSSLHSFPICGILLPDYRLWQREKSTTCTMRVLILNFFSRIPEIIFVPIQQIVSLLPTNGHPSKRTAPFICSPAARQSVPYPDGFEFLFLIKTRLPVYWGSGIWAEEKALFLRHFSPKDKKLASAARHHNRVYNNVFCLVCFQFLGNDFDNVTV